ncbi:MAG: transglycosylase SLT domain-containing protein [Calditrichae bacterium]|nr:transglycosylase SLT domain-containing protein [Calditrichia bacterium]
MFCIILLFAACVKQKEIDELARTQQSDSLMAVVESRLAEKKKLQQLKDELFNSKVGQSIDKYKPIIKKYSKRYGFDWRLITAQIIQESGFREKAHSRAGARGLMQLMPLTAKEISRELDIEYIMKNPRENITAGIYHLKKQMRYFPDSPESDRTQLALASYNAGAGRVFDAQDIAKFYHQPQNRWPNVRPYLSMLKHSDWELHLQIWPKGQPQYGYFYGYNETINYVDRIWDTYNIYKKIL